MAWLCFPLWLSTSRTHRTHKHTQQYASPLVSVVVIMHDASWDLSPGSPDLSLPARCTLNHCLLYFFRSSSVGDTFTGLIFRKRRRSDNQTCIIVPAVLGSCDTPGWCLTGQTILWRTTHETPPVFSPSISSVMSCFTRVRLWLAWLQTHWGQSFTSVTYWLDKVMEVKTPW